MATKQEKFESANGEIKMVPLSTITCQDDLNVRSRYDKKGMEALAEDIGRNGLLEPIGVTNGEPDAYKVAYGYRRYFVMRDFLKLSGETMIPVVVRPNDVRARVLANWNENEQREKVSDFDRAQRLRDMKAGEYPVAEGETPVPFTIDELAEETSLAKSHVYGLVQCIGALDPEIVKHWKHNDIPLRRLFDWKSLEADEQLKEFHLYLEQKAALEAEGRVRRPKGAGEGEGEGGGGGSTRPSVKKLQDDLDVLLFKRDNGDLPAAEKHVVEAGIKLLEYVTGAKKLNPLVSAEDRKALERAIAAQVKEEEAAKLEAKEAEKAAKLEAREEAKAAAKAEREAEKEAARAKKEAEKAKAAAKKAKAKK